MTKQENVTIIEPYTGDWIDRAFDWYYDKESDYASDNIRDYDRQMFREAIEKQEEDYLEEVKALQSLAQKNLEDSEMFLNSIKQDLRSSIYLVKTAKLVMIGDLAYLLSAIAVFLRVVGYIITKAYTLCPIQ